jgi:tRNA(Ile)-lysidine synthase
MLPEAIDRFFAEHGIGPAHLLVACSGGGDSTALLVALAEFRDRGFQLTAAHVNHHLRAAESNADEDFVRELCASLAIPFERADGRCDEAAIRDRGVEAAAREVRLQSLHEIRSRVGAAYIVTAHHQDDQAETLLVRLLSGSGVGRLGAMPPITKDGVVRPLISVSRRQIETFLAEHGIQPRFDRSNDDPRFLRNRIRHELLPLLKSWNPKIVETLAETARQSRDSAALLEPLIDAAASAAVRRSEASSSFNLAALPGGWLTDALLHREIRRLDPGSREISAADLARIRASLPALRRTSVTRTLELVGDGKNVLLRPRTRQQGEYQSVIEPGQTIEVPGALVTLRRFAPPLSASHQPYEQVLASLQSPGALGDRQVFQLPQEAAAPRFVVRNRRAGDRFRPLGLGGEKKVSRFLIDRKIPQDQRASVPLLVCNDRIIWVAGLGLAEEFKVTETPRDLYEVSWERR